MVCPDFLRRVRLRFPLSNGKSSLRNLRPEVSQRAKSLIRLLSYLMLSIALGTWAEESSRARIQRDFDASHSPSLLAWQNTLQAYGWVSERSSINALRTLPTQADRPGSVWWNSTRLQLVVFNSNVELAPWAFARGGPAKTSPGKGTGRGSPTEWESVGQGWDALSAIEAKIRQLPAIERKKAKIHDPRALNY